MQPNDARQGQGHRLPKDSVCPSPSNVLRLIFHSAGAEAQHGCVASFSLQHASSLLASLFQLALAICKYLIIHSGTDTNSINSINTNSVVNTHLRCHDRLSAARAAHTHAQTHYSSLNCAAIVDGRRGQLIVRTKSLARFFVVLRDVLTVVHMCRLRASCAAAVTRVDENQR